MLLKYVFKIQMMQIYWKDKKICLIKFEKFDAIVQNCEKQKTPVHILIDKLNLFYVKFLDIDSCARLLYLQLRLQRMIDIA